MSTLLVVALGLSGCQNAGPGTALVGDGAQPEASTPATPPVSFTTSVRAGAKDVRPDAVVTVGAAGGELHAVQLRGGGKELRGKSVDGTWRLADVLAPGTPYQLTMTGTNEAGQETKKVISFSTLTPKVEATYRVTPDKETVGVGMPVMVTFDSAVKTPAMRAAVEKRLSIKTTPAQQGSWGWLSSNQVMWRPATYWKPNTKVAVNAPLKGVQTGEGKWVTENKGASFTIAPRARISTVDIGNHVMTVRENGKTVATYPVSNGRPEKNYPTRTGTKVITEKRAFMVMDAASLGVPEDDPNYYRTEVNWAMRVTNTGEFLHSAPWSVWAQGNKNVSHGCVNMGPSAAKKMFKASLVGDVVDFVNGSRKMKPGDGLSVWLFSFPEWKAKSAVSTALKPAATPTPGATPKPGTAPTKPRTATATATPTPGQAATTRPATPPARTSASASPTP
ncbi:L,D-transpeptidase [Agilicoccus flavus]|uniref:L,D-transpeptidase n=1 Tax=Agilicoccus flavus TaxID=2775968 RepID=UPI001CF63782|nr:Ig-like domain-containing protein [Agilicoccus flavus]